VFELVHVPREQNVRADLQAKLGSLGRGQTEDSHPGNLKDTQNYHRLHGRGPTGKCLGSRKKRSPVIDPGNVPG